MKSYKIAIGMKIQKGPWGGGNQFGMSISNFLISRGWKVVYNLDDSDIDLILLTEPRKNLLSCSFDDKDILHYLIFKNSKAIVVHRINECDERKGTEGVNKRLIEANFVADYTIYISSWLKKLFEQLKLKTEQSSVILNGGDINVFNSYNGALWNNKEKLKLVTHHWGKGYLKGFDIYLQLDQLLNNFYFKKRFEFTYIGNKPDNIFFKNSTYIPPKSGNALAKLLKKNHIYITGSLNEPAGMHHIEGALCGLPLLYRESGALPEYCKGFGISFNSGNFEKKLNEILSKYHFFKKKIEYYPHKAEIMCKNYYEVFNTLLKNKERILTKRKLFNKSLHILLKAF